MQYQRVLSAKAAIKLQSHHILSKSIDTAARWIIQPLPFQISFPHIKFRNGRIPWAYNTPTFLLYLGFRAWYALAMLRKLVEKNIPVTKNNIMRLVQVHINTKWRLSRHRGAIINTLRGYSLMGEMGFTEEFVWTDIGEFDKEVQKDEEILENFFEENPHKNLENLELVNLIQEFLYQRMLKLMALNQAFEKDISWIN